MPPPGGKTDDGVLPSTVMGRLAWHTLVNGGWPKIADRYVFDTRKLTNDAPYFAAYVKTKDLPQVLSDPDRLEPLQDEWGYLLIWATLGIACVTAAVLLVIPLIWGWRSIFSKTPGKTLSVVYFACLGAGYIMVEVGLIAHFVMALGNPTVSASILITGMLVFSGLGALVSERILDVKRVVMPIIFVADRGDAGGLRALSQPRARRDRRAALSRAARALLPVHRAAGLPDGLPDADGDDDARAARQGAPVHLGLGRQRLLLGDRRRGGAGHRDQFRPRRGDRDRRARLFPRAAVVLRRAGGTKVCLTDNSAGSWMAREALWCRLGVRVEPTSWRTGEPIDAENWARVGVFSPPSRSPAAIRRRP